LLAGCDQLLAGCESGLEPGVSALRQFLAANRTPRT
jgi:hypothetical protein